MSDNKRIGIMGGTFDPVHIGHLFIAEAAREAYSLDRVAFIPTGRPPHKNLKQIAPSDKRLQMLRLATQGNEYFTVETMEIDRNGTTYTVDTLKEMKLLYPDDKLFFIIGGDTLMEIHKWRSFEEVAKLCSFIVYRRPGFEGFDLAQEATRLLDEYNADINYIEGPFLEISSSEIRNRISTNKTIKYLVPEAIEQYIINEQLYKGELVSG